MSNTRRGFLQSAAALAAGANAAAQTPAGRGARTPAASLQPVSEIQVPKMKFGGVEISRLVLGCNPFLGEGHFNPTLAALMREYFTPDRVCSIMHQCNRFGINAYQLAGGPGTLQRFESEGGKMHLIVQGGQAPLEDQMRSLQAFHPLAIYNMGETVDRAFQTDSMDTIKEWCKKARDKGVMVGVGTHKPEVIALVEEQNWDVDFYAGCVYNRTRTDGEWRELLHGELMEMSREMYLQSDPARMYKVMRQTRKPCFAFKILAAGRIPDGGVERAFRTAFESIKPTDGVFVGMFPRVRDQVRENAEIVHRILAQS
jgi:hypothetical protein